MTIRELLRELDDCGMILTDERRIPPALGSLGLSLESPIVTTEMPEEHDDEQDPEDACIGRFFSSDLPKAL